MRRHPYPKARKALSVDGVELNYELQKNKTDKPLLVLLHGLGGDLAAWDAERIILFEQGYSIMACDLRGHGFSGRPEAEEAYELEKFASDINSVLEHEGYNDAVIVGHCFGGVVAIKFAGMYTEMLKALVLIDTTYKSPLISQHPIAKEIVAKLLRGMAQVTPTSHLSTYHNLIKAGYAENWDMLRVFSDMLHTSLRSWLFSFSEIVTLDLAALLRTLRVRTLVITGEDDAIFPPLVAKEIHHLIKKSDFASIPLANHILVVNNPAEVSVPLLKFLGGLKK